MAIRTIQYGDLKVGNLTANAMITHSKAPIGFTVPLDCPFCESGLLLYEMRHGTPTQITFEQPFTQDDLLPMLYSLEILVLELDTCLLLNAWWASWCITALSRLTRAAGNKGEHYTYLERLKLEYPEVFFHASLMSRPKFVRNGKPYVVSEELLRKINAAVWDFD